MKLSERRRLQHAGRINDGLGRAWLIAATQLGDRPFIGHLMYAALIEWPAAPQSNSFAVQLIYHTAAYLEDHLMHILVGRSANVSWPVCQFDTVMDQVVSRKSVDHLLVRYKYSSKDAVDKPLNLGYCGDGADVKGLKLFNGVMVLPGNLAAIGIPQVILGVVIRIKDGFLIEFKKNLSPKTGKTR